MLTVSCALYGQQLTRIAVVDLARVYTEFSRESQQVRDLEQRVSRVNTEVERRTREATELRARWTEAQMQNNQTEASRLETQYNRALQDLNAYYEAQMAYINDTRARLMQPGAFMNQVVDEIRYVAESEGYTLVFRSDDTGIVWFSSAVNITDRVIQSLRSRR
jgi:outer membrane protein